MNMQQMMAQAQKMQRELRKAQAELAQKEFKISKGGAVIVIVLGNKEIKSVEIDNDAFDAENKEMIALAINEALEKIDEESEAINERITGQRGGFGF